MKGQIIKCCFCGTEINSRDSHNPAPIGPESFPGATENRCCSDCNMTIVSQARILLSITPEDKQDELLKKMQAMPYQKLAIFLSKH